MIKSIKILIFLIILLNGVELLSQKPVKDTLAGFIVLDRQKTSQSTIEFDLYIKRYSDKWYRWANGTFEFTLPEQEKYKENSLKVDFIKDSSQISNIDYSSNYDLSNNNYKVNSSIMYFKPDSLNRYPLRICISVIGPEKFNDTKFIPLNDSVRIGRFKLSCLDSSINISEDLDWIQPYSYYQASAYKLPQDSLLAPGVLFAKKDDNIELSDWNRNFVSYSRDSIRQYNTEATILCEYLGVSTESIKLSINSTKEYQNKGFVVKREIIDLLDPKLNKPETEIFNYKINPILTGIPTSKIGKNYGIFFDTITTQIPFRDKEYVYNLYSVDFNENLKLVSKCNAFVKHSVIIASSILKNPFSDETVVKFELDDDIEEISFKVFDAIGRESDLSVIKLHKDKASYLKKGVHQFTFRPSDLAQQGLYDIVITAFPKLDKYVTSSRSVIKAQFVK